MNRKLVSIGLACFIALIFIPFFAHAQEQITGPWLWMIAPTEPGRAVDRDDIPPHPPFFAPAFRARV